MPFKMRKINLIFITLLLITGSSQVFSQSINSFYIGHSLSDQIPDMVKSLAVDHSDVEFDWVYQSIPGAPLRWQWDRKEENDYVANPPYYYPFYDQEGGLPAGNFNTLVLTESVPRYGELINETYEYADSFFVYANEYNPNIKVYLYEDWHCVLSGTPTGCDYDVDSNPWRQRLEDDLPMWESVVDTLNTLYSPENPVCLIPAAQGLAHVYDSIYAGVMPGLTDILDIFSDNIHLTDVGKYFVACVHFATLFETSPVGLTNQTQVWWGGDFEAPSPELALKFQEIAWMIANEYPNSCLSTTTSLYENDLIKEEFSLENYPNPFSSSTEIEWQSSHAGQTTLIIVDIFGKKVTTLVDEFKKEGKYSVNYMTEDLPAGTYFYQLKIGEKYVTKKMVKVD